MKKSVIDLNLLILVAFLLSAATVYGQPGFEIYGAFEYTPSANLKETIEGTTATDSAEFKFKSIEAGISYTSILSTKEVEGQTFPTRIMINRFSFNRRQFEQDFSLEEELESEAYIDLGYNLIFIQNFSQKWGILAIIGTSLAVDELADAQGKDLAYMGGFLFDRRFGSGWTIGLGPLYAQVTGQGQFLPFVHLAWGNQAGTMEFEFVGNELECWYHPAKMLSIGLVGKLDGAEYMLTGTKATLYKQQVAIDQTMVRAEDGNENVDAALSYSALVCGPALKIRPIPKIELLIEGGITLARRYEFRAPEENETLRFPPGDDQTLGKKMDFDLENAFTGTAKLSVSF